MVVGHCEMICAMVNQLTKNATLKELEEAGLSSYYADHNKGLYPVDASGVPFTATYFAITADPIAFNGRYDCRTKSKSSIRKFNWFNKRWGCISTTFMVKAKRSGTLQ